MREKKLMLHALKGVAVMLWFMVLTFSAQNPTVFVWTFDLCDLIEDYDGGFDFLGRNG